jgi:hypothetical protein
MKGKGLNLVTAAILSTLFLANAASAKAATTVACPGAGRLNTSIGGSDAHDAQISAIYAVTVASKPNALVGYEYQTYGGTEFIEFNFGPKLTFYKLTHGSIFDAFQTRITHLDAAQSSLPAPFASLAAPTQFERALCASQD